MTNVVELDHHRETWCPCFLSCRACGHSWSNVVDMRTDPTKQACPSCSAEQSRCWDARDDDEVGADWRPL